MQNVFRCVKLRQSDKNLCESYHSYEASLTRIQENIIEDETQSEMAHAMMVSQSLSKDDGGAIAAMTIEANEVNHHEDSHKLTIMLFVKTLVIF